MGAYSFQNVQASLSGPGGNISLGYGSGNSEEGISTEMIEDKDTMVLGADGTPMHSLHAGNGKRVTIRLLKTSPINALLSDLYNFQTASSGNHGQNVIVISDVERGDVETVTDAAFTRFPAVTWAKDANMNEWTFQGVAAGTTLGIGQPTLD